jgi:hypothetical protein
LLYRICVDKLHKFCTQLEIDAATQQMLMQTQHSIAFVNSTFFNLYLSILEICENHKEICKYKNQCIKRAREKGKRKHISDEN